MLTCRVCDCPTAKDKEQLFRPKMAACNGVVNLFFVSIILNEIVEFHSFRVEYSVFESLAATNVLEPQYKLILFDFFWAHFGLVAIKICVLESETFFVPKVCHNFVLLANLGLILVS